MASVLVAACATPVVPVDAGRDIAADTSTEPRTYTFVIDQLTIDADDSRDHPHTGFNLDGLYSEASDPAGCNHADFGSGIDPDQNENGCVWTTSGACHGGVDNQLSVLADTIGTASGVDVRNLIVDRIARNEACTIVQVADVNGFLGPTLNDPDVTVKLFECYPTFTTDCDSVLPNREYSVAASSVTPGSVDTAHPLHAFAGSIQAGRLSVISSADTLLPIEFFLPPLGGRALRVPLHALRLRVALSSTEGMQGNLGGFVRGDQLVQSANCTGPEYCTVVEGAIGGLVDIALTGTCEEPGPPRHFGGIGFGWGFHLVPATIRTMDPVLTAQTPGTCGAPVPVDGGIIARDSGTSD